MPPSFGLVGFTWRGSFLLVSEPKNSGRLPAFQFYPADWRKDPGVQSLDFETRGIWWEIICLMHESDERGVLMLNGAPMPESALCRLLGLDNQKLQSALSILLTYGVAKRRDDGAIFNSRMVKDESLRKIARESGHQGGNPALKGGYKAPGFVYAIRRASDSAIKIGIAQNVTNRFNKLKHTHKGDSLTLEGIMPSQDMGKDEESLHREFADCCILGEWFKIEGKNLEKLFTLMGINKGETRASSSSSSSSSFSTSLSPKPSAPPAWNPSPEQIEVASWFSRKPTTEWSKKEKAAWLPISTFFDFTSDEWKALRFYYRSGCKYCRQDLQTLLNNWNGEIDRAKKYDPDSK